MKKSHISYPGIFCFLVMLIMFSSCAKKYGCFSFNFSEGIDHEALYHPNVTFQTPTAKPFGKSNQEGETPKTNHSIPPNP